MQPNDLLERNTKRLVTTTAPYVISALLVILSFSALAIACVPQSGIHIEKTGPAYAIAGEPITYTYLVSNPEGQPLSDVTVTDDSCGPVTLVSGDHNHNGKLEHSEVWTFTCITTPAFTFPDPLINTATASGVWNDEHPQDTAAYTLYPFILRKDVLLYWEGDTVDYQDPATCFTVQMSKCNTVLDTFSINESEPLHLWLSQGTYHFKEIDLPAGYIAAYDTITITTGETYPDFSALNIISFDLSVQKTGPQTCYPGDEILYDYTVRNSGPASITPLLLDDRCGTPVYTGGDSDHDGLIDPTETWTFEASYVVDAEPGSILSNTVVVSDAEGAGHDFGDWWLGGDVNLSDNHANWSVTVLNQPEEPENPEENDTGNTTGPENPDENGSENPSEPENPEGNESENPEEPVEPVAPRIVHSFHFSNVLPVADANGPYAGSVNEVIVFDGSHSADQDGFLIAFDWDFGDGSTATGDSVVHFYAHAGVYLVTLTVIDNLGGVHTDFTTAKITLPNRPPDVPLIGGPGNGTVNTGYFYAIGSTDEDLDDLVYHIDWGDGTAYEIGPFHSGVYFPLSHEWTTPGTYIITATASDGSLSAFAEKQVAIQAPQVSNLAIIILAFLALLVFIAVLLYSRRRRKNK